VAGEPHFEKPWYKLLIEGECHSLFLKLKPSVGETVNINIFHNNVTSSRSAINNAEIDSAAAFRPIDF
jgi:hypothetical protein